MNFKAFLGAFGLVALSALTFIKQPVAADAAYLNLTPNYNFTGVSSNFYRTTENKVIFQPITWSFDFEDDTAVYDKINKNFTTNAAFRGNFSGFEVALVNTSGSYRSPVFRHNMDFTFLSAPNAGPGTLRIANTFQNAGTTTTLNTDIPFGSTQYHTILVEHRYLHFSNNPTVDRVTTVRWGDIFVDITTPFTSNIWETTDAADTTNNLGFRILANGSSRTIASWASTSEPTEFITGNFNNIADQYYSNLISWYYNKGIVDADSSTLIRGFQAVIGILVNFVLVVGTLEVFDISILSILTVVFVFASIAMILKFIRG
jgi:hypothetical protein